MALTWEAQDLQRRFQAPEGPEGFLLALPVYPWEAWSSRGRTCQERQPAEGPHVHRMCSARSLYIRAGEKGRWRCPAPEAGESWTPPDPPEAHRVLCQDQIRQEWQCLECCECERTVERQGQGPVGSWSLCHSQMPRPCPAPVPACAYWCSLCCQGGRPPASGGMLPLTMRGKERRDAMERRPAPNPGRRQRMCPCPQPSAAPG